MAKVLLGFLLGLAVTCFAVTQTKDGSLVLSPDEVQMIEMNFYQLNYNFNTAVERVHELTKELEDLKKRKCI